ncbi:MAG: N-acetyltransferase [Pseudomonadota bacterium]
MNIQFEKPEDKDRVRTINLQAFETSAEADLVDALRLERVPVISLVAHERARLFGHILFSPVTLEPDVPQLKLAALGPMAVVPEHQDESLGSMLVAQGLDFCRAEGYDAVVVLGYAGFYSRFGFVPAFSYGIRCQWDVPDDAFMIRELREGSLNGVSGTVRYHEAFAATI